MKKKTEDTLLDVKMEIEVDFETDNNTEKKTFIESEKYRSIIEIAMAILTLLSVILVLFSNCEMKKQRQSAYKPVLSIGENIYSFEGNIYNIYSDGSFEISDEKVEHIVSNISPLSFKLENIGLGIAKNVKCEWSESNIELFYKYFQKHNKYDEDEIEISNDGDLQIIKYKDTILIMKDFSFVSETPFIKTDNSENNYIMIDASVFGYLCLLDAIYYNQDDSPELVLNVSYEDMYSKKYSAEVHINYIVNKTNINKDGDCTILFKTNTMYK